ncbi:GntR family transcriptional regulator [Nocardia neocaledoniensis]|uniref:GntR family transcriptional regulator n=2 Tax=Nocardia neocaledoniensis TaxID=236511 RepID=UPI00142D30BA|nr:GntR family transcriptional regulator [Nocardia neocaledoniensis]
MPAKYELIADDIRQQIASGQLIPGDRIPGESSLIEKYKVSPPTLRQALQVLRSEGLLDARHGIGTFVRAPRQKVRRDAARYQWEKDRVRLPESERRATGSTERDTGVTVSDLRFSARYSVIGADERIAGLLAIAAGDRVLQRDYRTMLDHEGMPLNLSTSYLSYELAAKNPELLNDSNEPWPGGTQHQLFTIGIEVDRVDETISTRPPTVAETEELDLSTGVSVFVVQKRTIDTTGRTVEFSDVILPGDRTELVFSTKLNRWDAR